MYTRTGHRRVHGTMLLLTDKIPIVRGVVSGSDPGAPGLGAMVV